MPNFSITETERSQWLSILDAASKQRPDELDSEWNWLMDQLNLSAEYFPSLMEAIAQGRWRKAKNPRAYLKTVARREAYKAQRAAQDADPTISVGSDLDHLAHVSGTSEAIKGTDGIWRRGGGRDPDYDDEDEDEDGYPISSYRDRLLAKIPKALKRVEQPPDEYRALVDELNLQTTDYHLHAEPLVMPDWSTWANVAGFGEWECFVLKCRLEGVSRDKALAEQRNEENKRALQAAWRKFDRTGFARLQEAAKNIRAEMSRNVSSGTLDM